MLKMWRLKGVLYTLRRQFFIFFLNNDDGRLARVSCANALAKEIQMCSFFGDVNGCLLFMKSLYLKVHNARRSLTCLCHHLMSHVMTFYFDFMSFKYTAECFPVSLMKSSSPVFRQILFWLIIIFQINFHIILNAMFFLLNLRIIKIIVSHHQQNSI